MPFYKWDSNLLSVKVNEMDREHQILIDKMNAVFDAAKAGMPKEKLTAIVNDFASYTVAHFRDEESYMEKIGFSGLATHKIIHKQLLDQVSAHVAEFQRTGILTDKFFDFLGVWLTSHIRGIDAKYGASAKKQSA